MIVIHVSDLHASKDKKEVSLKCLHTLIDYVKNHKIDYCLFCGDFWDCTITNTKASGFTEFLSCMKELSSLVKVIMITGTPFHEAAGSLDVFKSYNITVCSDVSFLQFDDVDILALPEPRRSDYIKTTAKEIDREIQTKYQKTLIKYKKNQKPFIIMYHGEICGAKYQNGISVTSSIALSKESLVQTQADYIACGHIHNGQEVFKNCWYSGSCYPKNFGETHDCCFNVVKIENDTDVKRVSFGIPRNKKITIKAKDIDTLKQTDFSKVNLLVEVHATKAEIKPEQIRKKIQSLVNAISVKVVFVYEKEVSVRSKEIVKKSSLLEKFEIYQKLNNNLVTNNQIRILRYINENLLEKKFFPTDVFELEYISIRGSLGLKDGLGVDNFEINFNDYTDGVVAIIGNCGKGKTTIIENCHPYPQMLTRGGALKEHFLLKDSHRILIYKTGNTRIKIIMQIDAVSKNSDSKYFVEIEKNGEWESHPAVDGSLSSYKSFVEQTFGSVDLFLRTSFFAREQIKSIPDLSRATKGEKVALFSALAGIDYLYDVQDYAKIMQKEIEEEYKQLKSELSTVEDIENRILSTEKQVNELSLNLKNINKEISTKESKLCSLEELQNKNKKIIDDYNAQQNLIDSLEKEIAILSTNLENYKDDIECTKDDIEDNDYVNLSKQEAKYKEKRKELETKKRQYKDDIEKLKESLVPEKTEEIKLINEQLVNLSLRIANVSSVGEISDICPTCGELLSTHKKEQLLKIVNENENQKKRLQKDFDTLKKKRECLEKNISRNQKIKQQIEQLNDKISKTDNNLSEIAEFFEENNIAEIKTEHILLEKTLEEYKQKLTETNKLLLEKKNKLKEQQQNSIKVPKDNSEEIDETKQRIQMLKISKVQVETEEKMHKAVLSDLKNVWGKYKEKQKRMEKLDKDLLDLSIIIKAFGNTGIPAIELDSIAPEISEITNYVLSETYGDRFQVFFTTQRDGKQGQKIDDFVIVVFDREKGREKKLELLSSGECIWIKQALFFAFSILRTRRTGFCFRTRFLDESDGSLDSEARLLYLKMIETAHNACNSRISVLITHSQELKDVIEQKIEL